ncbi:preprotein translocase [Pandoraea anapnoica]|uniref:Preprotein translocase n=1 Tax=Pandoraea anapnoica TaxID=2508301 RepID=A0A5E5AN95_9BURK|nr:MULTISPECIES: integrase family protein [Pandoraea]VVE58326.1 preprotein translocase [Pandoraea iniqua]VVE75251.1 preprotein translocase [Pandoraea anapnoica]
MNKVNFTSERVAKFAAVPGRQQTLHWDAKTPGLGVRVTLHGAKSYIFEGRLNGKTIRITIGDTRSWTIAKAQTEATRLRLLTDQGRDPREEKREVLVAAREAELHVKRERATVSQAWTEYLNVSKANWGTRHLQDHINLAQPGGETKIRGKGLTRPGPLAPMMQLRLAELTPDTVSKWLAAESADRPTGAEQSYRKLRAFLIWCDEQPAFANIAHARACSARAVKESVPRPKMKKDCLQREQLEPWFSEVRNIPNPVISAYLQALLITGARREELAQLSWGDVDFQWGSLSLSDKVEETGRIIPLTPYLAELLKQLPRVNEWVFSSITAEEGRIVEPRKAHMKALDRANLPHISVHGLRRSFGTLCEWIEMPAGVSAQIMGHKPSALAEKHYRRRPLDMLRMWHNRIEQWMLEQANLLPTA